MALAPLFVALFAASLMGGVFGAGWMVLAGQVGIAWVTR